MSLRSRLSPLCRTVLLLAALAAWCGPGRSAAADPALEGVKGLDVVFDVSRGDAKPNNVTFWAVRDLYRNAAVKALPRAPRVVVVFRGPAVRLLSTARRGATPEEAEELDAFAATLRELKREGAKLEVCLYAVKVMKVDPSTLLPEVDRVENGFVSLAGYQNQGYAVIGLP